MSLLSTSPHCSRDHIFAQTKKPAAAGAYLAPDWNARLKTVTTYDLKGRVVAVTAPDGRVTQKAYQPWSELLLDANGRQTAYVNDGLGRLLTGDHGRC